MTQPLYKTGGTQPLFGLWIKSEQAWQRDATGSVAMYGKDQVEAWFGQDPRYEIKEVFICCAEDLVDSRLPGIQQRWQARDQARQKELTGSSNRRSDAMSKTLDQIAARPWVKHVDDERNIDNGVIVTLQEGWEFALDPGCGVRGFDTLTEARDGTTKGDVRKKAP